MPRHRLTRDPSGIRSSKPLVPPVKLLLPPTARTGFSFFSLLFSFFVPIPSIDKEISSLDRLETTIANWVDPLHPRFCPSSCAFPFPKVDRCRHPIASKEILALSDLRC